LPDSERARAKVNLYLHVTGRRADGYHLLDSLAVFADVADILEFEPAPELTLRVTGQFAPQLATEPDNLVLRAARSLAATVGVNPHGALTLRKHIPVASGIGGGSADAAAALRLLCRAWGLQPGEATLDGIAGTLGADVPVCRRGVAMRMRGVGEQLSTAPALPACGILLVNPGVPLATVSVFRARTGSYSAEAALPDGWPDAGSLAASLAGLSNDLQPAAISLVPAIAEVLSAISGTRGCLVSRMSGSGATCFGLFASAREAEAAAKAVARNDWWCWGGALAE
jgi:4-diphosphocytidyl-2-C-methyl-D-erythritol kinase